MEADSKLGVKGHAHISVSECMKGNGTVGLSVKNVEDGEVGCVCKRKCYACVDGEDL